MNTPYGKTKSDDDLLADILFYGRNPDMRHVFNCFVVTKDQSTPSQSFDDGVIQVFNTEKAAKDSYNENMPDFNEEYKIRPAQLIWED